MRHVARRADASVNVSRTHPLAEASTLFIGLGLLVAAVLVALVFAIELLIRFVPPQQEARWLANWSPIEAAAPQARDEQAAAALLAQLAAQWPDAPYTFRLGVTEELMPNAFALPGGMIVVTRGLLDAIESENELAFVLAHELGHFRNRDHIRQLGRIAAIGLFVSALGAADGSNIGMTLADLTLRGFGREQEAAADHFALSLVHGHYGHVAGSGDFFRHIVEHGGAAPAWIVYLGTHPAPTDRVDALAAQADAAGWSADGALAPWPPQK